MAVLDVLNWKKEKVGTVELAPKVFGVEVKPEVLHTVVRWQLACKRQGTHMTKTKGLVSGGGKKPFKQKGTGNARQGSTRSPLMPGGGTIFGPVPRDYSYALPKKVRRLGLSMALSQLVKDGNLLVVNEFASTGKTAQLAGNLKNLGADKTVVIDDVSSELTGRASKNMKSVKFLDVAGLNVFDLLKYNKAVVTKSAIAKIVERCLVENA